jgi:hypothetical protein
MRLRFSRLITVSVLAVLSVIQLGSQSPAQVSITAIPTWGQDGQISGLVSGIDATQASLYVFEFIPDLGWYEMPGCATIPIQSDGSFSANVTPQIYDRAATRFSAYLVPSSLSIPCVQAEASVPFIIQLNALSVSTVPRLPQYSTISFGGLTWYVKTAPIPVYPGPQFFIQQNAYVDNLGQLHLALTQCADSWCAGEIYTTQEVGYGTYTFTINSPVNNLDPNVTLGLFTWDAQANDQANREWDIEFSRWGNAGASANAQYVVQPYNGPNNISKFLMSPAAPSTHTVTWLPSQVNFQSSASSGLISQWAYPSGSLPVPTSGDVHLHMNFYVIAGFQSPAVPINQEVVISGFQYTPSGAGIGFSRTSDTTPSFLATTNSVPMTGNGGGCSGTVESDSPWLTVVGPNPVPAGGSLQYAVPDNVGSARTGNLILQSTMCNATLGGQILSVTQPGFAQPPAFFTGEVSLGTGVYYLQFPDGDPFGYYNFPSSSILFHYDMGFESFIPGAASDMYLYDFTSGHWWYTSTTLFPDLYDFTLNAWIYYFPDTKNPGHYTTNPRYFSNLTAGTIFTM